jgi:spore coat associated protein JA (CotJA)
MDHRQQMYRYNRMGYQRQNQNYGPTPPVNPRCDNVKRDECHDIDKLPLGKTPLDKLPLAMAYIPMQRWENVCNAQSGLAQGTIFKDLVKPYYPLLRKRGGRS